MIEEYLKFLESRIDGEPVTVKCNDGETIIDRIISVSKVTKDIICDVIETNHPEKFVKKDGLLRIYFDEIDSVL